MEFKLSAARISSVTLLYKLRNETEKAGFQTHASSQNSRKGLSYGIIMRWTLIGSFLM